MTRPLQHQGHRGGAMGALNEENLGNEGVTCHHIEAIIIINSSIKRNGAKIHDNGAK